MTPSPQDERPHVVILGGGFGGLAAARVLGRAAVRVTLVDQHNHHLFQPLLYQVATDIAVPLRHIVRKQESTTVLMARARAADPERRCVLLEDGELAYEATEPFLYRDKGLLATIGRSAAVAALGRLRFSGLVAWLLWVFVHIFYLISFRNRFVVLFEWAWLYATRQRGARVILERGN